MGQTVLIEKGGGEAVVLLDGDYRAVGARIVAVSWSWSSSIVVNVKEPQTEEFLHLSESLTLFTYLHLVACHGVAVLVASGRVAFSYKIVQKEDGFPLYSRR